MKTMTSIAVMCCVVFLALVLMGQEECSDADIASENLSKAADNFEVMRRVVFYNGFSDTYMLVIEGRCSILDQGHQLEVVCKINRDEYVKHFLGLSDNTTYFAEQLETMDVSVYHHRVIFKPQSILPEIEIKGSPKELIEAIPTITVE